MGGNVRRGLPLSDADVNIRPPVRGQAGKIQLVGRFRILKEGSAGFSCASQPAGDELEGDVEPDRGARPPREGPDSVVAPAAHRRWRPPPTLGSAPPSRPRAPGLERRPHPRSRKSRGSNGRRLLRSPHPDRRKAGLDALQANVPLWFFPAPMKPTRNTLMVRSRHRPATWPLHGAKPEKSKG